MTQERDQCQHKSIVSRLFEQDHTRCRDREIPCALSCCGGGACLIPDDVRFSQVRLRQVWLQPHMRKRRYRARKRPAIRRWELEILAGTGLTFCGVSPTLFSPNLYKYTAKFPDAVPILVLVVLSGVSGVVKTTVARELARATDAVYLRMDSIERALRDRYGATGRGTKCSGDPVGDCIGGYGSHAMAAWR